MNVLLAIFLGGGLGSCLRYVLSNWLNQSSQVPWGTILANIISSFILGYLLSLLKAETIEQSIFLLGAAGFCGGFSTFSTFSSESLDMILNGNLLMALGYICISFILGILAVYLGFNLSIN